MNQQQNCFCWMHIFRLRREGVSVISQGSVRFFRRERHAKLLLLLIWSGGIISESEIAVVTETVILVAYRARLKTLKMGYTTGFVPVHLIIFLWSSQYVWFIMSGILIWHCTAFYVENSISNSAWAARGAVSVVSFNYIWLKHSPTETVAMDNRLVPEDLDGEIVVLCEHWNQPSHMHVQ